VLLKILRANEATCRRLPTCDESFADRVNVGDAPARADNAAARVGFLEQTVLGHAKMVSQWFDCQTAPNYGKTLQNIWIGIPPIKTTFAMLTLSSAMPMVKQIYFATSERRTG
jgi:hypothetical protein